MLRSFGRKLCRLVSATAWAACLLAVVPSASAAPPAGGPAAPAAGERGPVEIDNDMQRALAELAEAMPREDILFDEKKRAEAAPKAVPPLQRLVALTDEMAAAMPPSRLLMSRTKMELNGTLALLG